MLANAIIHHLGYCCRLFNCVVVLLSSLSYSANEQQQHIFFFFFLIRSIFGLSVVVGGPGLNRIWRACCGELEESKLGTSRPP